LALDQAAGQTKEHTTMKPIIRKQISEPVDAITQMAAFLKAHSVKVVHRDTFEPKVQQQVKLEDLDRVNAPTWHRIG
jgi:hypothetical protein